MWPHALAYPGSCMLLWTKRKARPLSKSCFSCIVDDLSDEHIDEGATNWDGNGGYAIGHSSEDGGSDSNMEVACGMLTFHVCAYFHCRPKHLTFNDRMVSQ